MDCQIKYGPGEESGGRLSSCCKEVDNNSPIFIQSIHLRNIVRHKRVRHIPNVLDFERLFVAVEMSERKIFEDQAVLSEFLVPWRLQEKREDRCEIGGLDGVKSCEHGLDQSLVLFIRVLISLAICKLADDVRCCLAEGKLNILGCTSILLKFFTEIPRFQVDSRLETLLAHPKHAERRETKSSEFNPRVPATPNWCCYKRERICKYRKSTSIRHFERCNQQLSNLI